jgi:pimeloyl-ACP methyl ester carboxylesterase
MANGHAYDSLSPIVKSQEQTPQEMNDQEEHMSNTTELIAVDASGRRLALTRGGVGTPMVVLETGLGAESAEWERVQREVEQFTHVFRYDRANRGQSDAAPKPRSAEDAVSDLHALLIAAKLPAPYVLVGHSLGGIIVRLYAHHYPSEVAGLVLVDPAHEDQFERMSPLIPAPFPGEPEELTWFRDFWNSGWRDPNRNDEGIDFLATRTQAQAIGSLGDLPLLMLTAGSEFIKHAPPGNRDAARMQELWGKLQGEIMQLSSDVRQTLVKSSGHFIQREQPEVIVAAIRQIVEKVRGQSPDVMAVAQPASDDGW